MVYFAKWKVILVLAVCVLGLAYAAPNLLPAEQAAKLPGWLPHNRLNLGLDLQGGSHLLLEVDIKTVTRERLDNLFTPCVWPCARRASVIGASAWKATPWCFR